MTPAFRTERRVEFRDTDAAGLVHFSAFFFWMESAEHEFWRSLGVELVDRAGDEGTTISWPRVSASCDFLEAVRFGDTVGVGVRVGKVGRTSVTFHFDFDRDGRPVARGTMVAVRCRLVPGSPPESIAIPGPLAARLAEFVA